MRMRVESVFRIILLAWLLAATGCSTGNGPPGSPDTATVHLNGQAVVGFGYRR